MGEVGDAYRGTRERITQLVSDLSEGELATVVPACPEWTVKDVVAHVCGVVDDALAGRLDGVATDPWTQAQVDARREASISEVTEEWASKAPAFEGMLDDLGLPGRQAVFDCVTHEHDIRGALRAPGARDSDAVSVALTFLGQAFEMNGAPVRLRTPEGGSFGPEDAPAALNADGFDIIRSASGRRSIDQIRSLSWSGDVDAGLAAFSFGPFRPRETPFSE